MPYLSFPQSMPSTYILLFISMILKEMLAKTRFADEIIPQMLIS